MPLWLSLLNLHFAHWRWVLSVSSTITSKSRRWLTLLSVQLLRSIIVLRLSMMQPTNNRFICIETHEGPWGQVDRSSMPFCRLWTSGLFLIVLHIFTSSANIAASHPRPFRQSFMLSKKRTGPSTEPYGNPLVTPISLEYSSLTLITIVLLVRMLCI